MCMEEPKPVALQHLETSKQVAHRKSVIHTITSRRLLAFGATHTRRWAYVDGGALLRLN